MNRLPPIKVSEDTEGILFLKIIWRENRLQKLQSQKPSSDTAKQIKKEWEICNRLWKQYASL